MISFPKMKRNYKKIIFVGDFNNNVLEFENNKKVENFSHNVIPTITKLTRVTRNTAIAIDHFITNTVVDTQFKTGIIQTDLSYHFPIVFGSKQTRLWLKNIMDILFIRYIMTKNQQTYLSKNSKKQLGIILRI